MVETDITDELAAKRAQAAETAWKARLAVDKTGAPRPTLANVVTILGNDARWSEVLALNELSGAIEATAPPPWFADDQGVAAPGAGGWTDEDMVRTATWLDRAHGVRLSRATVEDAVRVVARRRSYHPIKKYLDGLAWDGKARLEVWLQAFLGVEDSPYVRLVGRLWMISAVARMYEPGTLCKYTLILEGAQDIGKSQCARVLGGPWAKEMSLHDLGSKDSLIGLRDGWIFELAELDGLSKHEAGAVKAFLSKVVDSYRPPYGRSEIKAPRSCSFMGTINPGDRGYLSDPTGNVRFWPIFCRYVDVPGIEAARDQLWAEAKASYQAGVKWWPTTPEENELCRAEQAKREEHDDREALIEAWLETDRAAEFIKRDALTAVAVAQWALGLEAAQMGKREQTLIGAAMRALGWERHRLRSGSRTYVYRKSAP